MTPTSRPRQLVQLDGLAFRMLSSTASRVDSDAPTCFRYHQDGELVWGEYSGDAVATGRFVGRANSTTIEVSFVHVLVVGGELMVGSATSVVERREDGLVYLVEDFEKDGRPHRSVCVQVVES